MKIIVYKNSGFQFSSWYGNRKR